ncbi:MAG: PSD1 and planctomycete cytochrome C domain-containing protein [Prosthecobacter sp.]|nr:PSD1 and planctomycete cytochrome C domain-containing protein [Prosthecobacter sp.]
MKLVIPSFFCLLRLSATPCRGDDAAGVNFFESKIRPVLIEQCYKCHSEKEGKSKGGLLLDNRERTLRGGDTGPAVVPGDAAKSLLLKAVKYHDEDLQMPPKNRLPEEVVADFEKWIASGAADPRDGKAITTTSIDIEEGRKHWAFQPISNPPVPEVKDTQWPRTEIDRFILAALEKKGIKPVADAEPETLRRRISFDLTGLPPSYDEAASSESSRALPPAQIAALLASPHFGERWGRYWLDIAGYSESSGGGQNVMLPVNFRYRDYVIAALNKDKPYNQFLIEQLAGDLLPADSDDQRNEQLIATGYLSVGTKNTLDEKDERYIMTIVDEMIDSTGRGLIGLTLGCAKCHDHKFDPVSARDYYALAGIFRSSEPLSGAWRRYQGKWTAGVQPLAGQPVNFDDKDLDALLQSEKDRTSRGSALRRSQRAAIIEMNMQKAKAPDLEAFYKTRPEVMKNQEAMDEATDRRARYDAKFNTQLPFAATAMRDVPKPSDCEFRVRGDFEQKGEVIPRGFPAVLTYPSSPKVNRQQSGRLEFAQWLVSPEHPLTARVMVNRIWQHLFGEGIVSSPDDFGKNGQPPSNPALLDYLAHRFRSNGWSVKQLIAEIMNSRVYRLSTAHNEAAYEVDPANQWLWHMNHRRLDADAIRDSLQFVSGALVLLPPKLAPRERIKDPRIKTANPANILNPTEKYRSVYRAIMHEIVPDDLAVFDFPEPELLTGRRGITTVPTQALYMLNSPFVVEHAKKAAQRVLKLAGDEAARVTAAHQLMFARNATDAEVADGIAFIRNYPDNKEPLPAWTAYCQTLFASAEFRYLY